MDVGVHERQHPGAADGDRRGRRVLPHAHQRRAWSCGPDLFEQHTVHFHGYPNASAFYDGVPDASVAINIGGSFTYYYLAPGCRDLLLALPHHAARAPADGHGRARSTCGRGRTGWPAATALLRGAPARSRATCATACDSRDGHPVLQPAARREHGDASTRRQRQKYAYNDGDGSTRYDVEYPLQMHGFDPNFHFVGMTFNPEGFTDMKDKYFLLNGRSYPDTVTPGPVADPVGRRRRRTSRSRCARSSTSRPAAGRCCASPTSTSPSTRRWPRSASR